MLMVTYDFEQLLMIIFGDLRSVSDTNLMLLFSECKDETICRAMISGIY